MIYIYFGFIKQDIINIHYYIRLFTDIIDKSENDQINITQS